MKLPAPDVTVILATRNRAGRLSWLLPQLAAQSTGGAFTYDVLVVDNGSTDETRRVVEARQDTFSVPLHYAHEPAAGKSYALNTGMALAHGRVFAFTDDDVRPTPTWLQMLWRCLIEENADAVTGRVCPCWMVPPPDWLTDEALQAISALGCVDHGERRLRSLDGENCRWVGSNLAVRREASERVGPFDVRLTRRQDTDYYRRAVDRGLAIVYEPAALISHEVPAERLTKAYFRHWYHRAGRYRAHGVPWNRKHLITIMPLDRYRHLIAAAAGWVYHGFRAGPDWRQFRCELVLRQDLSIWWWRLRLWPRWWLTVLTRRSFMPE